MQILDTTEHRGYQSTALTHLSHHNGKHVQHNRKHQQVKTDFMDFSCIAVLPISSLQSAQVKKIEQGGHSPPTQSSYAPLLRQTSS